MTSSDFSATDEAALQREANELVDLGLERYGSNRTEQALACWQRALEIGLLQCTSLFLYVALDRARGNLGMARHRLKTIQTALVL